MGQHCDLDDSLVRLDLETQFWKWLSWTLNPRPYPRFGSISEGLGVESETQEVKNIGRRLANLVRYYSSMQFAEAANF
jgi:hypothetical protein